MEIIKVYRIERDLEKIPCLVKEYDVGYSSKYVVDVPKVANDIFVDAFHPELKVEEYMYLMACDSGDRVKGLFIVSQGMINGTLLNIHGIMTRTLLCGASRIIVARNPTSGKSSISKEDEVTCNQLKSACEIMGVTLMDFMILSDKKYSSFKEKWLL